MEAAAYECFLSFVLSYCLTVLLNVQEAKHAGSKTQGIQKVKEAERARTERAESRTYMRQNMQGTE